MSLPAKIFYPTVSNRWRQLTAHFALILTTSFCLLAGNSLAESTNPPPVKIILPSPPREFRAAWIATVANIDWPSRPGLTVLQQQGEMISLLDRAAQLHFNAVFFQVRSLSDAVYPSTIEPWTEFLTGLQGRAPQPYYDPLAFVIAQAHKRGLQVHAWFNPFRAGDPDSKSPRAANHITRTAPALVRHYAEQIWLDPGEPAVQARALEVILDVLKRYDVDGIVLDDYFYPYPEKNAIGAYLDFPDTVSWRQYGIATGMSRSDWRRDNVNRFVLKLSQSIKASKPWVQFGLSPFGIWRPKSPPQIAGMDAYSSTFVDARKWLAEGWVDYLAPQLYWAIADRAHSFSALFDWWHAQDLSGHHVWPGLDDAYVNTHFPADEIIRQLQLIRSKPDPGAVQYHLRSILENPELSARIYAEYSVPALVPPSPWINAIPPGSPTVSCYAGDKSAHVLWQAAPGKPALWWILQCRSNAVWNTQILPAGRIDYYLDNQAPDLIAVRAVDRLGNVSEPTFCVPKHFASPVTVHAASKIQVKK